MSKGNTMAAVPKGVHRFSWKYRITALVLVAALVVTTFAVNPAWFLDLRSHVTGQAVADGASEFQNYLSLAQDAANQKDYALALKYLTLCEKYAGSEDKTATACAQEAAIYFQQGQYAACAAACDKILSLGDQKTVSVSGTLQMQCKAYYLAEDYDRAVDAAAQCLDKGIGGLDRAEVFVIRGASQMAREQYSDAEGDFQAAVQLGYHDKYALEQEISLCQYLQTLLSAAESEGGGQAATTSGVGATVTGGGQTSVASSGGNAQQAYQAAQSIIGWNGLAYYALGMYEEAAQAYEQLLHTDQTYYTKGEIYACIAKCRIFLEQYDAAVKACDTGLTVATKEEQATLYALRGTANMAKNQNNEAVGDFDSAVSSGYTDYSSMYSQSAYCYYAAGDYQKAVEFGQKSVEAAGKDTEATLWVAMSYYSMEDYADAATWLTRSLTIQQNYCSAADLYVCLSRSYLLGQNFTQAVSAATSGIAGGGGENCDLYAIRGAARMSQGSYNGAVSDFDLAVQYGYADPLEMYRQATMCCFLQNQYSEAVAHGLKAAQLGTDPEVYFWVGVSYFSMEDYTNAIQWLNKAISGGSTEKNLYFYRGIAYFATEQYESAKADFTQSISRGETKPRSLYDRALCEIMLKDNEAAYQDIQEAASQSEDADVASDANALLKQLQ